MAKKETKKKPVKKTVKEEKKTTVKKDAKKEIKKETKKEVVKKEIKKEKKKEVKTEKKDRGILLAAIGIALVVILGVVLNFVKDQHAKDTSLRTGTVYAVLSIQGYDDVLLELDADTAPITVTNFINLANSGFYDGLTFHRMIKDFMMQGGDPSGNGNGDNGKTITGEFSSNGHENNISHVRGTISMARGDDPDSASTQFFIVTSDSTYLDGKYAAFGSVVSGMETLDEVMKKYATKEDKLLPEGKRPVITSIREITIDELLGSVQ